MKPASALVVPYTPQLERGITRDVYVVQTYAVGPAVDGVFAHYEIQIAPEADPNAPRVQLITTDRAIYERALKAEDTERRFDATWHRISTTRGLRYHVDRFDER